MALGLTQPLTEMSTKNLFCYFVLYYLLLLLFIIIILLLLFNYYQ
jgi:hypothetical protein